MSNGFHIKRTVAFLLLSGILAPLLAESELLENTDFSKRKSNGRPLHWSCINGTESSVSGEGMTIRHPEGKRAVMIQTFRPQPGKRILFSVEVKPETTCKVRAYLECEFPGQGKKGGFHSGSAWKEAKAGEWITLQGELAPLPDDYTKCYLAVWNDNGTPMLVRKPHAEIGADILIRNADFSKMNDKNAAHWTYYGKKPESLEYEGNAVRFSEGILLQKNLNLTPERSYRCSFMMRGGEGAMGRCYVEWSRPKTENGKAQGQTFSSGWQKATPEWTKYSFTIILSPSVNFSYIVLGSKNQVPVEFKDLKIEEIKPVSDLGGIWDLRQHGYSEHGLELQGMKPAAQLRNIPVTPGKKYELSYQAQVLKSQQLSDDGGFFRLRSTVFPDGIIGKYGNADILHGQGSAIQNRAHVFTVPADSKISHVDFAIRGGNPGEVRLSHFAMKEIPIEASDSWSVKLLHPFYRDAFFCGDDASVIEGEAECQGAEKIRIALQDKVFEIPVTGKITKFQIPFGLPEGKYPFRCDFLKNGKVEKSIAKDIAYYPSAENTVIVTSDRKIRFNGKPFFPVYVKLRPDITEETLYFASRAGINASRVMISYEEELLKKLDLAQKYGVKLFIDPSMPAKASSLPRFKKNIAECLTSKVITHPALLGYIMPDEPLLAGIPSEVIQEGYRILKELDPYHPCWLNAAPRNSVEDLRPYGGACDILSVDIYPIPYPNAHSGLDDKYPTCCGKYALHMNEVGCGKKAIGVFLQGFAWHECTSGPNAAKKPYPSRTESRFMAYDSLLNGSTGYWLWGTGHVQSEAFYRLLYELTTELHRYSGLFAEGKQLPDLNTSNPAIRCAVMEYAKQKYFFLLNLTAEPQQAEVPVQGKILDSDGGTFADGKVSLAPYEVVAVSEAALPPPLYPLPERNEALEKAGDPAFRDIVRQNRIRQAPLYRGTANWIWVPNRQPGGETVTRCFAEKTFTVSDGQEKVSLLIAVDDSFIAYLNGKEIARAEGWAKMYSVDLAKFIRPGENRLTILGMDAWSAPCGILAEIHAGDRIIPTDAFWKAREAYKGEALPDSLDKADNAVIVAPYGRGAWGGNRVRIFDYSEFAGEGRR